MFSTETSTKWFEVYTDKFKTDGILPPMLALKKEHSKRVSAICVAMAESMEWEEDNDRWLAYTIGLLHDTGRFTQYSKYETFLDSESLDHGDLAVEILQREFDWDSISTNNKEIILKAVKYHNKIDVPTNMPLSAYRWACLVRDADKIDIFHMIQNRIDNGTIFELLPRHKQTHGLSQKLIEEIKRDGKGSYSNAKSLQDYRLIQLTWGCDLNFPVAVVSLQEDGIFERIRSDLSPYRIDDLVETLLRRISSIL